MGVVPLYRGVQFAHEHLAPVGKEKQTAEQELQRENESLHHGNRTVPADRAVTGLDSFAAAPVSEGV